MGHRKKENFDAKHFSTDIANKKLLFGQTFEEKSFP
jgi:hypothetical protein